MSGLRICLFIAFLAIVDVGTGFRGTFVSFDNENQLRSIPGDWDVEDPSIVINIDVSSVNVDKINTGAFRNFTILEELELTGRITAIEDDAFTGMVKLERITLNGVGIQDIGPKVFYNLNNLKWLDVATNEIKEIHGTNLTMLTKLNLYQNNITQLSNDTFVNLENLESIDLSENKIRALKNGSFDGCPNLVTINLNENQIADIEPNAFIHLPKLEILLLSHNNLTTVTVQQLPNLKSLDLSYNKITFLEEDTLLQVPELTNIELDHNLITRVDKDYFVNTPKLEFLDLAFNLIKELNLPDKLEKLRRVSLHHNKLESIELSAATQMNIEVLDLSDNNLTHLNESFQHLINLEELSLNNNKLKSFSLCIPDSLTYLDLSHNKLHGIALDKFCGSVTQGKLQRVDLSSNQFTSYNLTYTNKSLQETQPDLNDIDLSFNFLNADSVKQIEDFELRHLKLLKIKPQLKDDVNINLNENMNGEGNNTWIVVTSSALAAVAVFAVIAAILAVCKQRRRTNPNPNVNDAVMLNELYDEVGPARANDDDRSSPDYHYPTFRPWYDEVRPQPVYLSVLPDIPGPQQLEQQDNGPEENIYEEID